MLKQMVDFRWLVTEKPEGYATQVLQWRQADWYATSDGQFTHEYPLWTEWTDIPVVSAPLKSPGDP